jgi:hypothetical protein
VQQDALETKRQTEERLDPNRPMTDEELKACVDKVDEIMGFKRSKDPRIQKLHEESQGE